MIKVVIDTQEKKPYTFEKYGCTCINKSLKTGDYSLLGMENEVTIERKTLSDLVRSLGQGRERFEKEFTRMQAFKYPVLIIESSLKNLTKPFKYSKMTPAEIINSLLSWSIKYGVCIFFGCNRELSENLAFRILEKYQMNKQRGSI